MKALVVGSGGFLGAELITDLTESGYDVKSLGRNIYPNLNCEQILADIKDPGSYENALATWMPEVVIQAAWVTNQSTYRTSPLNSEYMEATLTFAEKCFQSETQHFLALGSSAEYGMQIEPCNAFSTSGAPLDIYGTTKLQTLERLEAMAERFSRKLSWARIFQPYGPNQDSARLIPYATKELLAGRRFRVANPNLILDWISSRDVASALTYALKNPIHYVFDVGTSEPTSVRQALQTLATLLGVDPNLLANETKPNIANEQFAMVVSDDSPLFKSGWRPQDDLNSGLRWTLSR